jgi:hypothetical protein
MFGPIVSKIGLTLAKNSAGAPVMIAMVPALGAARAAADRRIDNLCALFDEGAVRSRVRSARLQALGFVYRRGLWVREEVDQRLGCNRLL